MFKRKLISLGYPSVIDFNVDDDAKFRNLVVWLEDMVIRFYKIEDRSKLRDVDSKDWDKHLNEYLRLLAFREDLIERNEICDSLLGFAVRTLYNENVDKYKETSSQSLTNSDTLTQFDFTSDDFKKGVESLATLLQIQILPNTDHLTLLKAINLLLKEKINKNSLEKIDKKECNSDMLTLDDVSLGFQVDDTVVKEAAKILRLLHIKELRSLQTEINQIIVQIQSLTANPKTDTKIGKVGK